MERNNLELSQLEYLICLRAISFSKKCYLYLTPKQRCIFYELLRSMDYFEQEEGRKTVLLSELISDCKATLDDNVTLYQKKYGNRISNTFSKESIRGTIYLTIPLYFNIIQHNRAKVISMTPKAKEFFDWSEQMTSVEEKNQEVQNILLWLSKNKVEYVEEHISLQNNNSDFWSKNNVEKPLKTTSPIITNKSVIKKLAQD